MLRPVRAGDLAALLIRTMGTTDVPVKAPGIGAGQNAMQHSSPRYLAPCNHSCAE